MGMVVTVTGTVVLDGDVVVVKVWTDQSMGERGILKLEKLQMSLQCVPSSQCLIPSVPPKCPLGRVREFLLKSKREN